MGSGVHRRILEFGAFRIDAEERSLFKEGRRLPITPKVFDLLLVLVENRGHTVDKDELMNRVWKDTFVYEGNLNKNISNLRKVLGDDRREPKFIATIPKRGYRFDGHVREFFCEDSEIVAEKRTQYRLAINEMTGMRRTSGASLSVRSLVVSGIAICAIAAAAWLWLRPPERGANAASIAKDGWERSVDPEALELYREGRRLWQTRAVEDLYNATTKLEQAVKVDPGFARAHAALADAYAFDYFNWVKAESVATTAISLDPELGQPHATIGFVKTFWEWKPRDAEPYFKRAIELDPDYAIAHQWYGISHAARGRMGFALAEMRKALDLDPNSLAANADMCQLLYFSRRYDLAADQCRKTLDIDPSFENPYKYLYDIYTEMGRYDDAVDLYFRMIEMHLVAPISSEDRERLRAAHAADGIRSFWAIRAKMLEQEAFPYRIGRYYARLGEKDISLQWFRRALETRDLDFLFIAVDPVAEPFSRDPAYLQLANTLTDLSSS